MTMGPVQLLVLGFEGGELNGEILAELDRLREDDVVRLIDLAFVRKDDNGNMEKILRSDLSAEEAEAFGCATASAAPAASISPMPGSTPPISSGSGSRPRRRRSGS